MKAEEIRHRYGENALLVTWARISAALALPVMGVIGGLGWTYVEHKFDTVTSVAASHRDQISRIREVAADDRLDSRRLENRVTVVETLQDSNESQNEEFRRSVIAKLDDLQDSNLELSNAISAIRARLNRNDVSYTYQNIKDAEEDGE